MERKAASVSLSIAVLLTVILTTNGANRDKRQAPNINVHEIPKTGFSCDDKKMGEYYADPEARCQVYHICIPGMNNRLSLISFVCPNGTIFSQATKVCTPYERVDCRLTSQFTDNIPANTGSNNYESGIDYDNFVPNPPPPRPQPARQNSPSRSRNTPAPPPPPPPSVATQAPRNRFRSGNNQFRGQQAPPVTPRTTLRTTVPPQPALPVRNAILSPARPAPPAFRSPLLAARPPQSGVPLANALPQRPPQSGVPSANALPPRPPQSGVPSANALPARPTPRSAVSTSTSTFNYEYEYEYDYLEEQPADDQANARSKREIILPEEYYDNSKVRTTNFTCDDKVPGAAYADLETNCEMFHICVLLGKHKMLDYKVMCANGTAFDQESMACVEKKEIVCENSTMLYQFGKSYQSSSNKKVLIKKNKYSQSKKPTRLNKE